MMGDITVSDGDGDSSLSGISQGCLKIMETSSGDNVVDNSRDVTRNLSAADLSTLAPFSRHNQASAPLLYNQSSVVGNGNQLSPGRGGRECSYVKGVCRLHGGGARRCWKPVGRITNGEGKSVLKQEYFYVCDLGLNGRIMSQPMVS